MMDESIFVNVKPYGLTPFPSRHFVLVSLTYGFIMLQYQMLGCTLIQCIQEEKLYKNVPITFWLGHWSEVLSHVEARD